MTSIIFWIFFTFASQPDVARLEASAPHDLDEASAREHFAAGAAAAFEFRVDPALVLAIAHHESRYQHGARGHEPGGRRACGVMTPTPLTACHDQTLLEEYEDGAAHLRTWIDATRSIREALLGYAGGYRMIEKCRRHAVYRATGDRANLCLTPEVFLWRSRKISGI